MLCSLAPAPSPSKFGGHFGCTRTQTQRRVSLGNYYEYKLRDECPGNYYEYKLRDECLLRQPQTQSRVPSCPRVLMSSCPRALVPSCPRVLVSSCPRVRSGNPVLRWNNGSEFAMNGTFVPGPQPAIRRKEEARIHV